MHEPVEKHQEPAPVQPRQGHRPPSRRYRERSWSRHDAGAKREHSVPTSKARRPLSTRSRCQSRKYRAENVPHLRLQLELPRGVPLRREQVKRRRQRRRQPFVLVVFGPRNAGVDARREATPAPASARFRRPIPSLSVPERDEAPLARRHGNASAKLVNPSLRTCSLTSPVARARPRTTIDRMRRDPSPADAVSTPLTGSKSVICSSRCLRPTARRLGAAGLVAAGR